MARFASLILTVLVSATLFGCSGDTPKTYPVRGIVHFPDGKPLTMGTVEFQLMDQKQAVTATGTIGKDGTFELGTFDMDDGAIPGRHRVVIVADQMIGTGAERPGKLPQLLHPRYREFDTSGLEFTVQPDDNAADFTVDPAPVKPQRRGRY